MSLIETIPQRGAALLMAATLAGNAPDDHLLEIRCLDREWKPGPREWFPVGDYRQAAAFAIESGAEHNAYVGALPRVRRGGGREDVAESWVLWAEIDAEDAVTRFSAFAVKPSILVLSGTPGHALGVWQLREPLPAGEIKPANRRLAYALGADLSATDCARVLRVPGTLNHKTDRPQPVACVAIDAYSYRAAEIVGGLPDPPERRRPSRVSAPLRADDPLATIPAEVYVPMLTGREIGRDGMIRCPFHGDGEERTPSLHVYPDDRGWFCFACERGGSIFDLGSELWGLATRGADFHELRRRLAAELLLRTAS
jgi:RepB DNA-primase from phage plasmid/CHC2 zinc finger